jgi:predicted esterase
METHTLVEKEDGAEFVPNGEHTATLVWLHGLGDSAYGFVPYFSKPKLRFPTLKIVLPTATQMPVTVNHGMVMNSWYDVPSTWDTTVNESAWSSADRICAILAHEAQSTSKLFLGGISQGGATSLLAGFNRYTGPLAGIIALSSYALEAPIPPSRLQIPCLIYHGDQDSTINIAFSKSTYDRSLAGVNYTYKVVPNLPHWVNNQEMIEMKDWIQNLSS